MATAQEQLIQKLTSQGAPVPAPKSEVLEITHDTEPTVKSIGEQLNPVSRRSRVEALQVKGLKELDFANSTASFWTTVFEKSKNDPTYDPSWQNMTPFERIQQSLEEVQGLIVNGVEAPEPVTLDILRIQELLVRAKNQKGMPVFGPIEDQEHGIMGWAEVIARDEVDGEMEGEGDFVNGFGIVLKGESIASHLRGVSDIKILWTHDPRLIAEPKSEDSAPQNKGTFAPPLAQDHQKEGPATVAFRGDNPFTSTIKADQITFADDFNNQQN